MRKFGVFLAGLIVGLMTGGVVMLLFAPESGATLQKRIREWVERLIEEGKSAAESRRLELEQQLESFKQGRPIVLQTPEPPTTA
ncbi:MAG TPA: YtxH domain-containing protein [Anaerolineae bacterium]|nr:YtxH domain-containing protein [Anaerolineae bacterium]HQK13208.1 YtxH domain-containing protein [Anaerolineae bacterium]